MTQLPSELYSEIHRVMPIVCVDVVVHYHDKILMIKRKREPAKGQFWFPGGRLFKKECLKEAAYRIVKSETGLSLKNPILIGHDETRFLTDPFGHYNGTHTINFVYSSRVSCIDVMANIVLDENHSDAIFYHLNAICDAPNNFHRYLKKFAILADATIN